MMFTDGGGPDHNCKQLSMRASLLSLFSLGVMGTMVVLITAPQQSWTNSAKRIMLVLNLGLQGCALARTPMGNDFEVTMRKCNGMDAIHRATEANKIIVAESLKEPPLNQVAPLAIGASSTIVLSDEQYEVVVPLATSSMVS